MKIFPILGMGLAIALSSGCKFKHETDASQVKGGLSSTEQAIHLAEAGLKTESKASFMEMFLRQAEFKFGDADLLFAYSNTNAGMSFAKMKELRKNILKLDEELANLPQTIARYEKIMSTISKEDLLTYQRLQKIQTARKILDTRFKACIQERETMIRELTNMGVSPKEAYEIYTDYVFAQLRRDFLKAKNYLKNGLGGQQTLLAEEKAMESFPMNAFESSNGLGGSAVKQRFEYVSLDILSTTFGFKIPARDFYLFFKSSSQDTRYATPLFKRQGPKLKANSIADAHMDSPWTIKYSKEMMSYHIEKVKEIEKMLLGATYHPQITTLPEYLDTLAVNKIEKYFLSRIVPEKSTETMLHIKWPPGSEIAQSLHASFIQGELEKTSTLFALAREAGVNRPVTGLFISNPLELSSLR